MRLCLNKGRTQEGGSSGPASPLKILDFLEFMGSSYSDYQNENVFLYYSPSPQKRQHIIGPPPEKILALVLGFNSQTN